MDRHYIQGLARKMISDMLKGALERDFFGHILSENGMPPEDIQAVRQEIQAIADTHAQQAAYHKTFWDKEQ